MKPESKATEDSTNPADRLGITKAIAERLIDRKDEVKVSTWKALWITLFPDDEHDEIPSQAYETPQIGDILEFKVTVLEEAFRRHRSAVDQLCSDYSAGLEKTLNDLYDEFSEHVKKTTKARSPKSSGKGKQRGPSSTPPEGNTRQASQATSVRVLRPSDSRPPDRSPPDTIAPPSYGVRAPQGQVLAPQHGSSVPQTMFYTEYQQGENIEGNDAFPASLEYEPEQHVQFPDL